MNQYLPVSSKLLNQALDNPWLQGGDWEFCMMTAVGYKTGSKHILINKKKKNKLGGVCVGFVGGGGAGG